MGWRNASVRGLADYMLGDAFREPVEELIVSAREKRVAIMCVEAVPWRCHRSLVADALNLRGVPEVEILSINSHREHKLKPFARVQGASMFSRHGTVQSVSLPTDRDTGHPLGFWFRGDKPGGCR
jgi:hypothetical protein